jgi:uncharacterized membrane protein required for colicin V production
MGILGTFGVVALYYFIPGFRSVELFSMLVVVGFGTLGYDRRITRGVVTLIIIYFATGVAATLYQAVTPLVGSVLQAMRFNLDATYAESVNRGSLALTFSLLTIIVWILLEILTRVFLKETSMPGLGILDKLGGLLIHLVVGALVAALLFNTYGYGRSRPVHDRALLRPQFNLALRAHYTAQSFWFQRPPPIYVYDLNVH